MSPKILPLFLLAVLNLPAWAATPSNLDQPRGRFVELHSCELFAGPCVISSEVNQAGNYILHVWQFDQGTVNNTSLRGLTVALLEKGDTTLAEAGAQATGAIAYLPPGLTAPQRAALLAWAQQNTAVKLDDACVKIAPMQLTFNGTDVRFSMGKKAAFAATAPIPCTTGNSCGEALWYQPHMAASSFVVDQLAESRIIEPLLSVRWMDHGRRTLFVGRFGDPEQTIPAICGGPATASL